MPIHPDWKSLYDAFINLYGTEGEQAFLTYYKKNNIDPTQPRAKSSEADLGKGVIEPRTEEVPPGYVKAEEILAILPK